MVHEQYQRERIIAIFQLKQGGRMPEHEEMETTSCR